MAAVVVALLVGGRPATSEALDPDNPGADGARAVARVLDDQGVDVQVVRGAEALDRAELGHVQLRTENAHTSIQVQATYRPSLRSGFTAYFVLSPVNGSFATVVTQKRSAQLDASTAASGPHDFAVRFMRARLAPMSRPPLPAPYVRADREAALLRARDGDNCSF